MLITVTAKVALPVPPAVTVLTLSVHTVPATLPLAHVQPVVLLAALNVVLAGTVSFNVTFVSVVLPVF